MNPDQTVSFYQERKNGFETQLNSKTKKINLVSSIRIATALFFLLSVYLSFSNTSFLYAVFATIVVFAVLVQHHSRLFRERVHLENLLKINTWEVQALHGDATCFMSGSEFIDPHHPYTHDLDIFGEGSLFQAINRSNTIHGKKEMAQQLSAPLNSAEDIKLYQDAIRELASRTDFRQHFQAAGLEIKEEARDQEQLLAWLRVPPILYNRPFFRIFLIAFPAITVGCLIAAFFVSMIKPAIILLALSQWAFLGFYLKRVNVFHEYISRKKTILEKYAHILHFLQNEEFTSSLLQDISAKAHAADVKIKSLASLVSSFNARLNAMTNLVVNSFLLYDLQCVYRLERWKYANAGSLKTWLDVVTKGEVLGSLATFSFNHPAFTYPSIHTALAIDGIAVGHPLIPGDECVPNDVLLDGDQSVLIITGANMAGKSTFLRAIGVNLVLALSGAVVCAKSFHCPIIAMRSGMRTADSLKDHESYFYAELNRLKTIMDELKNDKPLLILLDEILKGTNSTDKQLGSIALVKQLLQHPCLALIATHDLVLGALEKEFPAQLRNFCFEATIENDQLSFDYKLKPGLAQTMNATYLMKKMGIIPSESSPE